MKIAFLCSALEPGRDGVGDYTRRLAGELLRQDHTSVAIALNDSHISEVTVESQEIEGASVCVLRLPNGMDWIERATAARDRLNAFSPDWISLQFVPFAFHPKGLCFGLGRRLATLSSNVSWHIMFHELWLGLAKKSSVKHQFWGALQRLIMLDLLSRLRPQVVHTHAEPYLKVLHGAGVKASILPIFGNIPRVNGDAWRDLLEPLAAQAMGHPQDRANLYMAGVFGGVHPEWDANQTISTLLPLVKRFQKRLVLVFLGRNNLNAKEFARLKSMSGNCADIILVGERPSHEISKILQSLDLGLATTPLQIIQKSGSIATMLEHGLHVLVTRDDWRLRGATAHQVEPTSRLLSPKQFVLRKSLPSRVPLPMANQGIAHVASRMLAAMQAASC
ncbi:MAG TPA: hypothetical protein VGO67_12065 [Verrucomicrobiae bacterium]